MMPDVEKTIKGLECCIALQKYPDEFDSGCFECPYRPIEKGTCLRLDYLLSDALALLKVLYEDLATHKPCRTCAHFDECDPHGDSKRFDYWRSCVQGEGYKKKWAWRGEAGE